MSQQLNLARKWRPQTFDEIVGQDMGVSMLRNSLYQNHFFPVYLFSGQHGCGKTTTARVFATSCNCEKLAEFQKDPKKAVPCGECRSCKLMHKGQHPDFIEIDAASNTGVDDIRNLLESSSFLPLIGTRKIYLIDEVHMLSKSAFNAFLKLLEEPPAQVIFLLATTELHKLPETVRSRCFQILFPRLPHDALVAHLKNICEEEDIRIDDEAIEVIIKETEGSARDALNVLEQVRFAAENVSVNTVRKTLGLISENQLFDIITLLLKKDVGGALDYLHNIDFLQLSAPKVWQLLITVLRSAIWHAYKAKNSIPSGLSSKNLDVLCELASVKRLHAVMQLLWDQEPLFLQTPYKHLFLEHIFMYIAEQINVVDIQEILKEYASSQASEAAPSGFTPLPRPSKNQTRPAPAAVTQAIMQKAQEKPQVKTQESPVNTKNDEHIKYEENWKKVLIKISDLQDPILNPLFSSAQIKEVDVGQATIHIELPQLNDFLLETLKDKEAAIAGITSELFGCSRIEYHQAARQPQKVTSNNTPEKKNPPQAVTEARKTPPARPNFRAPQTKTGKEPLQAFSIPEEESEQWPVTTLLLKEFPGKLAKVIKPQQS